ncbi:hypothetical protein F5B18DRAFT_641142 [Nemania serpens]|nr:hypothetical protein F5B18DRAFT_641142 [Nemania serpens]
MGKSTPGRGTLTIIWTHHMSTISPILEYQSPYYNGSAMRAVGFSTITRHCSFPPLTQKISVM